MKKILVPIDFSENATQALHYAIQVANKFDASIHVLHAYQISSGAGRLLSIDHIVQEDREKELNTLLLSVKPKLTGNASIEGYVRQGESVDIICSAASKLTVDAIIMGTTGASGMKKMFLGSTASNVMKNTEVPVLAIPVDFKTFALSNITVALDSQKVTEPYSVHPVVELAKKFGTVVNLLLVVEDESQEQNIDEKLQEHFKQFGVAYTYFKLSAKNASQGIMEFVARKNSNMLCVMHHPRGWFQDIFHSSMAEKIAFDSKVPLFVLRG